MSDVTDRSAYDPFAPVSEPDAPELTDEAAEVFVTPDMVEPGVVTAEPPAAPDVTGRDLKPMLAEEIHPNETIETNMPSTTEVEVEDSNG